MVVRLIVNITAQPGKGSELLKENVARARLVLSEPGCEQYEYFQSGADPDRLVLLERWTTEEDLKVHLDLLRSQARPPSPLRLSRSMERYPAD
jgi:quinol monooxygenase YgiN